MSTTLRVALPAILFAVLFGAALAAVESGGLPTPVEEVGINQNIGAELPLSLEWVAADGRELRLGELFGQRPVVLVPVYYDCPMLCPLTFEGLVRALRVLQFVSGTDFDVVAFSIDPGEGAVDAAAVREQVLADYGKVDDGVGWHFLTGDEESIQGLTEAIGFRYEYEPQTDQYFHASGILVVTPEGRIAQYFYGVEISPKDLRLALVESSKGKLGSPIDTILLLCFQYDPSIGRYSLAILNTVRIAATVTLVGLASYIGFALHRDRSRRRRESGGKP